MIKDLNYVINLYTELSLKFVLIFLCLSNLALADNEKNHLPKIQPRHGISIFGDLKYDRNFKNFSYVNPDAPKTGSIKIATIGSFDSLNQYIIKGVPANGIDMIFDKLMENAADEESAQYGLVAESVEYKKNNNWIIFNLRKIVKWHDGSPLNADDVVFSFNILKEKGNPLFKTLYQEIIKAEKISDYKVKFTFKDGKNNELPFIIGQLPIISKKYYSNHDFNLSSLEPPLGSGPYQVAKIEPGRAITYKRVSDYWGKDLPVNKGRYNFDEITIDYYRDTSVAIEALKSGQYDFRRENISKVWASAYNIDAVKSGKLIKEELPDGTPTGMQSFVMNIRRPNFDNIEFRKALNYAFDFEWTNKKLFFGAYSRNLSFFGNSIYAATGKPSNKELELLLPFRDILPKQVFLEITPQPITNEKITIRDNLKKAQEILKNAGFILKDMKLFNPKTNEFVKFEILLDSPTFERVVAPFARNLIKLGIEVSIRTVDATQYIKRMEDFDFDMVVHWFTQGSSPGNEQINYWHSSYADVKASNNYIGIKNKAVDKMVEHIIKAQTKEDLVTATKALDRILLANHYVIPNWFSRSHRIIYWNKFSRPKIIAPYSLGVIDTWWFDKEKSAKLSSK